MSELHYVGARLPIRDAALKVSGQLKYTADLFFPGMLYGKLLFSPYAHARIKKIDTSAAEALPGVRAVVSCFNGPKTVYNSAQRFIDHKIPDTEFVFPEVVRFVGDRVAAVAADDLETAVKAIKLIQVEYEELPAVFDAEEALKPDAPIIHAGGNKVGEFLVQAGNIDEAWKLADHIFEDKYVLPAVSHVAIEPHAAVAHYDAGGKLTVWCATQNAFNYRILLGKIFDLPLNKVRVIRPAIGGAFGGKLEMTIEPVAALLAKLTGRHVKLELTRKEVFLSTRTRTSAVVSVKTGVKKDGTLIAHEMKVIANTGAYASSALNVVGAMSHKIFKMYQMPHVRFVGIPVYTNLPIAGAMRGYGSPQAFYAQQVHFRRIAQTLNLDFVKFQLKNLVEPDSCEPMHGNPMGNPRPMDCVAKGAQAFRWFERDLSQDLGGKKRGIGMAVGCHGNGCFGVHRDYTALILKMNEDGSAVFYTGTHDMGNGTVTAETQIIGEVLGIHPDRIECIEADTDTVPWNLGDYASRGVYVSGHAAKKVAENVKNQLIQTAGKMLGLPGEELTLKNGFVVSGNNPDRKAGLSDVIIFAQKEEQRDMIAAESFSDPFGPYSYGAHFAEVEVDEETGKVRVLDYLAVHDVGKAINPMYAEGQAEGGIQMGIGYALTEELTYDEKGKMTCPHLKKYHMVKASQMPRTRVMLIEEGEESGPYGAKSIGECATVPSAPAVVNAVCNALNINPDQFPLTPERIKEYLIKK
ncbi:xanthine dehydrogenase family protein molybdopterin-binding subunit [Candidatus Formimonas warabiya]|uniref:Xanthine dehydrogenase n=1 Tax=Formimonas warabiya TaxID=1761012 RepID=A0A3G1KTR0_FORW1|nr:molybdopterin cofactor-binding domain-containing protein [Candidatus Formimonas warabiya]ATW25852.1 xanthine dehydrogenase [Candidatus Formimonas warabiya]